MQIARIALALSSLAVLSLAVALGPAPQRARAAKVVKFASIKPILDKHCVMCHSGSGAQHGLDLTSYARVMKGDHEGKVIVAKNPAKSRLSRAIHRKGATPMPPMGALPAADVAKIDGWIKAGAKS